jgi:hypothetical protein
MPRSQSHKNEKEIFMENECILSSCTSFRMCMYLSL